MKRGEDFALSERCQNAVRTLSERCPNAVQTLSERPAGAPQTKHAEMRCGKQSTPMREGRQNTPATATTEGGVMIAERGVPEGRGSFGRQVPEAVVATEALLHART